MLRFAIQVSKEDMSSTTTTHIIAKKNHRAFTLIELLFVLVLMGLLAGLVIPRLANITGMNQGSQISKFAGFFQRAHQLAVLQRKNMRIVVDANTQQVWLEEAAKPKLNPLLPDTFEVDEVLQAFRKEAEVFMDEEEVEKRKKAKFKIYQASGKTKAQIPPPLEVASVFVSTLDQPIKEGAIYIPIGASGFHPTAILYITDKTDIKYSIVFPALSPRAYVEEGEIKPEDIKW